MANLLIVDDELGMRQFLTHLFQRDGHSVRASENGHEAMELLRAAPADLIISDVRMPDMDGIELLRSARELLPDIEVVMMTAFANVDTAREAFLLGAYDFVQKPFDNDLLKETVTRALTKISLIKEKEALLEENKVLIQGQRTRGKLNNIIGRSPKMQALYQMIETVAQVQSTVLVTGDSGTGKELVARAIHDLGPRAEKPFVSINCGAFTETLLESELFGYVKGSFTGANTNRKGLFEAANTGTVFLDEIGEMSSAMQVKLLRVLQERKLRPVGATEETTVDTRVIAATNRDLGSMVKEGTFREDLYYRSLDISEPAVRLLENYLWPGNVRELEHAIERAVALETTDSIQPERLPEKITNYNPHRIAESFEFPEEGVNLTAHLDQLEKTYVLEALRRTAGNQTNAAELLGMSVRSLRHLLDKHGIRNLTAQMRDERRTSESTPRRRASDPTPRRRAEDDSEFAASVGES
jgi:two-component system response regulator PilR (NtrC family)